MYIKRDNVRIISVSPRTLTKWVLSGLSLIEPIINNTWLGLHEDITKLMDILKKNLFPAHLIERVVNRYVTGTLSNHSPSVPLPTSPTFYFKLPYIGHFSVVTQKKVRHLVKRYCNNLDIKLDFSSF